MLIALAAIAIAIAVAVANWLNNNLQMLLGCNVKANELHSTTISSERATYGLNQRPPTSVKISGGGGRGSGDDRSGEKSISCHHIGTG